MSSAAPPAPSAPRPWSAHEDALLKRAVAVYGDEPGMWKTIAEHVPDRTNKACRKRWLHSLSPAVKKTPWTPEEDATLLRLYNTHTPPRWSLIAKHIPGRTDDACSKRYREALDPSLKRDAWSPEEDARLQHLAIQLGSKWSQVGQAMGRSGLACRNRWRLLQRKLNPRNLPRTSHPSIPIDLLCLPPPLDPGPSPSFSHDHRPGPAFLPDPPPEAIISTASSLTGALSSTTPQPASNPTPPVPLPISHPPSLSPSPAPPSLKAVSLPSPPAPPLPLSSPARPPDDWPSSPSPRQKRPRLSSRLPAASDPTILPYACGHPHCWSTASARFATASALAEHRRLAPHPAPDDPDGKLFRCALQGCGKGWKNINGIQYHLQISKAHFQVALIHRTVGTPGSSARDVVVDEDLARKNDAQKEREREKPKPHRCPHAGCPKRYKQRAGLQYHLAHGHPTNMAQLPVLPPGLANKFYVGGGIGTLALPHPQHPHPHPLPQ